MEISGVLSAIVIGLVIGTLGRLVLPGRQRIGILPTVLVGIVAALLGSAIAAGIGVADTKGVDWSEWLIQIDLAALGVALLDRGSRGAPLAVTARPRGLAARLPGRTPGHCAVVVPRLGMPGRSAVLRRA